MTISGEYMCLPHKDTSGPQTMECAFGVRTLAGLYYALDFNLMSQTPPTFKTGDRINVSGVFTPLENLSSNQWQKYPIEGILSVTNN